MSILYQNLYIMTAYYIKEKTQRNVTIKTPLGKCKSLLKETSTIVENKIYMTFKEAVERAKQIAANKVAKHNYVLVIDHPEAKRERDRMIVIERNNWEIKKTYTIRAIKY